MPLTRAPETPRKPVGVRVRRDAQHRVDSLFLELALVPLVEHRNAKALEVQGVVLVGRLVPRNSVAQPSAHIEQP